MSLIQILLRSVSKKYPIPISVQGLPQGKKMSNKVYLERVSSSAKMPTKGSTHAACFDLYADLEARTVTKRTEVNEEVKIHTILEGDYITLQPKERVLIPTGWKMQCPEDMSIDFVPRSGIAWKDGVSVINTPGIIDCDYPNECCVALVNHSNKAYTIKHGDRVAQMRLVPVIKTEFEEVTELPGIESNRTGGFGSSGK